MDHKEAIRILVANMFCNEPAIYCSDCRKFLKTDKYECLFANYSDDYLGAVYEAQQVLAARKETD